jgi:hypothetical protein
MRDYLVWHVEDGLQCGINGRLSKSLGRAGGKRRWCGCGQAPESDLPKSLNIRSGKII